MPIKPCVHDHRKGYKFGDSGKCYVGKDARSKAIKQMKAIKASKKK